jgi:hypothetical protein
MRPTLDSVTSVNFFAWPQRRSKRIENMRRAVHLDAGILYAGGEKNGTKRILSSLQLDRGFECQL